MNRSSFEMVRARLDTSPGVGGTQCPVEGLDCHGGPEDAHHRLRFVSDTGFRPWYPRIAETA